ncbi:type II toxin-antitoxin system death-on-curing family toxin [Cystobacter fuscus]
MSPVFLTLEDVLEIHHVQRERYGGPPGLRDPGLLESALAQPMATFAGEFIHPDLFTMAAAYLFHLVSNHPFVDGNKRIGLLSALVFLDLNGVSIVTSSDALYELTMEVAQGQAGKELVASRLRQLAGGD